MIVMIKWGAGESDESDLSDLSDLSDTYSLTCGPVDLLAFSGCVFLLIIGGKLCFFAWFFRFYYEFC